MPLLLPLHHYLIALLLITAPLLSYADETYVQYEDNGNYKEVTVDNNNKVIKETRYNREGQTIKTIEKTLTSGTTTEETFRRDGNSKRTVKNKAGKVIKIEEKSYGVVKKTIQKTYDKKGRLTQIDINSANGDATLTEYEYGKNGKLKLVSRERTKQSDEGTSSERDSAEWDEQGQLIDVAGKYQDLLKSLPDKTVETNPRRHVYKDKDGNQVIIVHNPDGSLDYTLIDPKGSIIINTNIGSSLLRCPKEEKCPLHQQEKEKLDKQIDELNGKGE